MLLKHREQEGNDLITVQRAGWAPWWVFEWIKWREKVRCNRAYTAEQRGFYSYASFSRNRNYIYEFALREINPFFTPLYFTNYLSIQASWVPGFPLPGCATGVGIPPLCLHWNTALEVLRGRKGLLEGAAWVSVQAAGLVSLWQELIREFLAWGRAVGEGLALKGLLLARGSCNSAQTNPSTEVTEQFLSAGTGAGLWWAEKSSTIISYYSWFEHVCRDPVRMDRAPLPESTNWSGWNGSQENTVSKATRRFRQLCSSLNTWQTQAAPTAANTTARRVCQEARCCCWKKYLPEFGIKILWLPSKWEEMEW